MPPIVRHSIACATGRCKSHQRHVHLFARRLTENGVRECHGDHEPLSADEMHHTITIDAAVDAAVAAHDLSGRLIERLRQ
jgi:hypothetical protein